MTLDNGHQTIGLRIPERLEQHRIDDGKNRGVRADAQRKRQHRGDGEARRAQQAANGVAEIVIHNENRKAKNE